MIRLTIILFTLTLFSCSQNNQSSESNTTDELKSPSKDSLIKRKAIIDSWRMTKNLTVSVFAKVPDSLTPIQIFDLKWPKDIEEVYNIWQDSNDVVVCVGAYPFSQSGDWDLGLTHYFLEDGNTFAFEKMTSFYNSMCTDDLAIEQDLRYYNQEFNPIDSLYVLTDSKANPLVKDSCTFPYNFETKVFPSQTALLGTLKINLQ